MKFTDTLFENILQDLSDCSDGLATICKRHGTTRQSFYNYMKKDEERLYNYARAREFQADFMFDEIIEVVKKVDPKNAHAIRVRLDAIKWATAKLKPGTYSDYSRKEIESKGDITIEVAGWEED